MLGPYSDEKSMALIRATDSKKYGMVETLLEDPEVDLEFKGYSDNTSFQIACSGGDPQMIKLFLDCKRPVDYNAGTSDWGSYTPLEIAVCSVEAFKMLVDDPRIELDCGRVRSALYYTCSLPNILEITQILLACERFDALSLTWGDWDKEDMVSIMRKEALRGGEYACMASADLAEAYLQDPVTVRQRLRYELGYDREHLAAELFATIVLVCDEYYEIKKE